MNSKYLVFAGMGMELVALIGGAAYVGSLIDQTWGWGGGGVALMSVLGLTGWMIHIIQLVKKLEKDDESGN